MQRITKKNVLLLFEINMIKLQGRKGLFILTACFCTYFYTQQCWSVLSKSLKVSLSGWLMLLLFFKLNITLGISQCTAAGLSCEHTVFRSMSLVVEQVCHFQKALPVHTKQSYYRSITQACTVSFVTFWEAPFYRWGGDMNVSKRCDGCQRFDS